MTSEDSHVILEFFSGIGGMRYAAEAWAELARDGAPSDVCFLCALFIFILVHSLFGTCACLYCLGIVGCNGGARRAVRVAASFEISEVCNRVYKHNFGDAPLTKSIEHLDASLLDSFNADTWLMSPPCQPYTSMGKQRDAQDPRARALLHLTCQVIPKLSAPPTYILLENVNHFQHSQSHTLWLEAMAAAGFVCHEFLLSPSQLGIPNERLRYYCLGRRRAAAGPGPWDAALCGSPNAALRACVSYVVKWAV